MKFEPIRVVEPEALSFSNTLCRVKPTAKQQEFLEAENTREVFFGGAAGGGKSVALLMGAMQYTQTPGYSALILRKDFSRLELPGGLIQRSHEWFQGTSARWNASRRQWIFTIKDQPDTWPATISFGYLSRPLDKFRYASSEFQYIAFDELTDFTEEDYLFLFSRLRRNTSIQVPLMMRSASNPGGPGHAWVKERFIPEEAMVGSQKSVFEKQGRLYIPSRITDNPHLDGEEYRRSLLHLPALERERLMNGDWSVEEHGVFRAEWLRYYIEEQGQLEMRSGDGRAVAIVGDNACYRFVTIDPAGTSAERAKEIRGWTPSWSVIQVWDQPPRELAKYLILRDQVRERFGFGELCQAIRDVHARWRPAKIWIEGEKLGTAVWDQLKVDLPIECLPTKGKDKKTRAGPLMMKMERGEVFWPQLNTTWRLSLEGEFLAWTGEPHETADQIDAAAYAAIVAERAVHRPIRVLLGGSRS